MSNRSNSRSRSKKRTVNRKNDSPFTSVKQHFNLIFIWALVVVNAVLIFSFVHKLVTPDTPVAITTDYPITDPIKVQVLNGCGVSGVANEFAELLQQKQYDVVDVDNALNWDYEKTVIINRERQDRRQVEKFRDLVGVNAELVYKIRNDEVESDLTLIIGADYENLKAYRSLH